MQRQYMIALAGERYEMAITATLSHAATAKVIFTRGRPSSMPIPHLPVLHIARLTPSPGPAHAAHKPPAGKCSPAGLKTYSRRHEIDDDMLRCILPAR